MVAEAELGVSGVEIIVLMVDPVWHFLHGQQPQVLESADTTREAAAGIVIAILTQEQVDLGVVATVMPMQALIPVAVAAVVDPQTMEATADRV